MSSDGKSSFFRQSGWMVMATFIGGIFMAGVQILAQQPNVMEKSATASNDFIFLLGLLMLLGSVPSAALQTIYAQQAAAAITDESRGALTAAVRALLRTTSIFWLALASLGLIFAGPISSAFSISHPAALRVTMLTVLPIIWGPTFKGVLQGLHRFAPLGWILMLEGVVRLGTFIFLVKWLKGGSTGGLWAVFIGQYMTLAIAIWKTSDVWGVKTAAVFLWKQWIVRGVPLTLGMGSYVFMSIRVDSMFTKSLFFNAGAVQLYNCAMFIGFAMSQFVAPIAAVMFPTIVRNLALSKKSNALMLTLAVTGGFAGLAATTCTLFPRLPIAILFPKQMESAVLVPWFVWALLPLTLANVLIQNLLAHERFTAAPRLILVPVLYVLTLMALAPTLVAMPDQFTAFKAIILTMGCYCLLLFGVAAWFTWRRPASAVSDRGSAGAR